MEELQKYLLRFDDIVTAEGLQTELQSLGEQWKSLKQSVADLYEVKDSDIDSESELSTQNVSSSTVTCSLCKACPLC